MNGRVTVLPTHDITLADIGRAAKQDDEIATEALAEYGQILGVLTTSVINLFNPELIIFGGPVIDMCPQVIEAAIARAQQDVLVAPAETVKIEAGSLKERAGTLGAVGMVLQDLFKPPIVNLATYRSLILPD
jgi:glucokinase